MRGSLEGSRGGRFNVRRLALHHYQGLNWVRDVLHNFNTDGFVSLQPKYGGGRPPKFTLPQRREIKKTALARPTDHGLAFSTWSLAKLADFLVTQGVVDDISHEGLRLLLREEGVSFQAVKTWKTSTDPRITKRRRTGSWSLTRSLTAKPNRARATRRSCSATTSSGR